MPSQSQQQKAARARISNLANPSTVWFWVGWDAGKEGQVGIVRDGDSNEQRGIVYGNIQPRRGAEVAFSPGQPIGSINVATVDSPGGGVVPSPAPASSTIFDNGDPNVNKVAAAQGDQYIDLDLGRFFIAGPNLAWISTAPYSFDSTSLATAEAIYVGDIYQANDGAFYRLDGGGSWILQYVCPDCTEEPDPPPDDGCAAGYGYLQPSGSLYYFRC